MLCKHTKTGNIYRVVRVVKEKISGSWVTYVEYISNEIDREETRHILEPNSFGVTFKREFEDFKKNFCRI